MKPRLLLISGALLWGSAISVAPRAMGLSFVMAAGFLLWRKTLPFRLWVGLVSLGALAALRACHLERSTDDAYEVARALTQTDEPCVFQGEIVASPTVLDLSDRAIVSITEGACGETAIVSGMRARVTFETEAPTVWVRGDRIEGVGRLAAISLYDNPGTFPGWVRARREALSGRAYVTRTANGTGIWATIDRARASVRERIEATYHAEAAPLGRALVMGESDLSDDVEETFRVTGLSHILAVSGTHLVVSILALSGLIRRLLLRIEWLALRVDVARIASGIALILSWLYVDFTGRSGSILRAAAMMSVSLLGSVCSRRVRAIEAFGGAMLVGWIADGMLIADISFGLSAASTAGLLGLQRPLERWLEAPFERLARLDFWGRKPLISGLSTTLAATLGCAPLSVALSGRWSPVGLLANVIAAPVGELFALPFALGHAASSAFPRVEAVLGWQSGGALRAVLWMGRLAESVPASIEIPPPTAVHFAGLLLFSVGLLTDVGAGSMRRAVAFVAALVLPEIGAAERGVLRVTAIDIGQGDSLLVEFPDGESMLIDAGGLPGQSIDLGARVVAPVLRARRRNRLDVVVLTHPHPDHYGGLLGALSEVDSVGDFWENGAYGEPKGEIASVASAVRDRGGRLVRPSELCGLPWTRGGATVEVLSPCPLHPDRNANEGSFVLKVTFGRRSALLMGDAEMETERDLLERARVGKLDLRADLLKIGHHGSRTSSSPEFLRAVRPRMAIISSGVRNRFGHPHPKTLGALEEAAIVVKRTDRGGAFTWSTDGDDAWVSR